jgi:uncharacterized membrane protein YqjE
MKDSTFSFLVLGGITSVFAAFSLVSFEWLAPAVVSGLVTLSVTGWVAAKTS